MRKIVKVTLAILVFIVIVLISTVFVLNLKTKSAFKEATMDSELTLTFDNAANEQHLTLTFKKGNHYAQVVNGGLFDYVVVPLMAIWAEDDQGNYLETLYVSSKFFQIDRPSALPVWQYKANALAQSFPDGVTGASNSDRESTSYTLVDHKSFHIFIEINRSYDYNKFYMEGLRPGDEGYNSDYSGQPSLIYVVYIDDLKNGEEIVSLIGHGSPDGSSGEIYQDLEHFTTAKELFSRIMVKR